MNHLEAEEAAARFAARPHQAAGGQCLLLRWIEVEKAQHQVAAVVLQRDHELAARPELDPRISDDGFDLTGLAVAQGRDRHDPSLVFIAQRQMQREVDVANQAELFERLVGGGDGTARPALGVRGRRRGHGRILPAGQRR